MLKLDLSHKARRFLDTLDAKQFRQILKKILALSQDPLPPDSETLSGSGFHRADIGEYRIIYSFTKEVLTVDDVGNRNDGRIYRHLK
jgi:mRNA interferase RelE/StbE